MEGRSKVAIEAARKVAANVKLEMIEQFPGVEFFHTIPMLALTQFGQLGRCAGGTAAAARPRVLQRHLALRQSNRVRQQGPARRSKSRARKTRAAKRRNRCPFPRLDLLPCNQPARLPTNSLSVQSPWRKTISTRRSNISKSRWKHRTISLIRNPRFGTTPQDTLSAKHCLPQTDPTRPKQTTERTSNNTRETAGPCLDSWRASRHRARTLQKLSEKFAILWAEADITLSASAF